MLLIMLKGVARLVAVVVLGWRRLVRARCLPHPTAQTSMHPSAHLPPAHRRRATSCQPTAWRLLAGCAQPKHTSLYTPIPPACHLQDARNFVPANRTVPPSPDAPNPRLTPEQIHAAVAGSLRRLQTDYVDLIQLHWCVPCGWVGGWVGGRLAACAGGPGGVAVVDLRRLQTDCVG